MKLCTITKQGKICACYNRDSDVKLGAREAVEFLHLGRLRLAGNTSHNATVQKGIPSTPS